MAALAIPVTPNPKTIVNAPISRFIFQSSLNESINKNSRTRIHLQILVPTYIHFFHAPARSSITAPFNARHK
jgi:hypothetical protein